MKRVLVVHYSQTGQLTRVLDSICAPLMDEGTAVDHLRIEPAVPFGFPWTRMRFFGVFPEAVNGDPVELKPFSMPTQEYDLVILGYTIWYLNPSIPVNSFLKHPSAAAVFRDKPVLTVIGARNMWVHAQEKVRSMVAGLGGRVVGNILAEDRSPNIVSLVTIIRWMFYGRKDAFLMFPPAGIRALDIAGMSRFGPVIGRHLRAGTLEAVNPDLLAAGSSRIKPSLLVLEKRALKLFAKYRAFIMAGAKKGQRSRERRVSTFSIFLPVAAFLLSPLMALSTALMTAVHGGKLRKEIQERLRY